MLQQFALFYQETFCGYNLSHGEHRITGRINISQDVSGNGIRSALTHLENV